MLEVAVRDAASEQVLVGLLSQKWQMLADANSVDIGIDWTKLAANLRRSIWLKIPQILL